MGQPMAIGHQPSTSKVSVHCINEQYCAGSSCMRGCRLTMDDSHTNILSLPDDPGTGFFAVYDGHGGNAVAQYAGMNLHKFIFRRPEYENDIEEALKQAFLEFDSHMCSHFEWGETTVGSTAVVVLIKDQRLYCANVGDAHAVVSIRGVATLLSMNHKPTSPAEYKRIRQAGGKIIMKRVNARLAVSRALGDYTFKKDLTRKPEEQMVTAYPYVESHDINQDYEFIVIACDGIWEVLGYQTAVDFCRARLMAGYYPDEICEDLMNYCVADECIEHDSVNAGGDNMTVIIVCFLHNKPYDDYVTSLNETPEPTEMPIATIESSLIHDELTDELEAEEHVKEEELEEVLSNGSEEINDLDEDDEESIERTNG